MWINGANLCIGCMNPLDDRGECSFCHFQQDKYQPIPRCLLPGTVLAERYVLGRVLGEGNFGITYMGWDPVLDCRVAIKEYYPSDFVSRDVIRGTDKNVYVYGKQGKEEYQENLNKFLNEARCLTRFNHLDGIVSVRDFFYENETAYIVMEYIHGVSVKEYIRQHGPMEGNRVLQLMKPVLETLDKIHKTGVIHRDISPDNILFSDKEELVLIDFGSARVRNMEMTKSMTVVFKRGFSPEEQYRAKGRQGVWSDVYAICATIYFMLTANIPEDAIERMIGAPMKSLAEMPEVELRIGQKQALMKGISIRAQDRYDTLGNLMAELYEEKPVPSRQYGGERSATGRKRLRIVVAGSIFLFFLAGRFFWNRQFRGETYSSVPSAAPRAVQTTSPVTASPSPVRYEMISCVGLTKKKAQSVLAELNSSGLAVKWEKDYSDHVRKGRIIRQSIKAGTFWSGNEKKTLVLILSEGPKYVIVPDVKGIRLEKAKSRLGKKNLKCKIVWENSSIGEGVVIRQSRNAGDKVKKGTSLTLTVSRGPAPAFSQKPSGKKPKTGDNEYAGVIS